MERIRESGRRVHRVYRETIEWRNPMTGLYLMAVNSAFWIGVIYCDPRIQEALLATSSACVLAWDILLSSSADRSIITHILMWPVQSVFRTFAVGGSIYSIHLLRGDELRTACYTAYATLACLLVNPVWEHNEINAKIGAAGKKTANWFGNWIQYLVITPIVTVYEYTKYIVLFRWVPPLIATIKHFVFNFREACYELVIGLKNWFHVAIVERVKRTAQRIRRFLRYWFCAEWWPSLREWLRNNIWVHMRYLFDQLCFVFVYVFCCHWVPPLWRFALGRLAALGALAQRHVLQPTKVFLLRQFERFRCWLRDTLHRIAIAVRDSIIWPICVLMVEIGKQTSIFLYHLLLEPVVNYMYGRYKIIETSALIYVLGPVCETVIENIPEKNPFCDDSDVEFDGFMPEVRDAADLDENLVAEDSDDVDDDDSEAASSSSSRIAEEELDFERGLRFGAVDGSESSDEEFDLHHKQPPSPKKSIIRRRRREAKKSGEGRDEDDEYEILQ